MHLRTCVIVNLICLLLCLFFLAAPSFATGKQVDFLISGLYDTNGDLLTGGLVYSYAAGTTTPKALYSDVALTATCTNPLVLDAYGRAVVYATGTYKLTVKTSAGVTLFTADNLDYTGQSTTSAVNPFGDTLTQTNIIASSVISDTGIFTTLSATSGTIASLSATSGIVASLTVTNFTLKAGGTFDGNAVRLTDIGTPTAAMDATNKGYVDAGLASAVNTVRTDAWTGDLNMGGYKILNLATPTTDAGATNKGYVDNAVSVGVSSHTHTQAQSHYSADTDSSATAIHHTLGTGQYQAAAGNHTHGMPSKQFTQTTLVGTWDSMPTVTTTGLYCIVLKATATGSPSGFIAVNLSNVQSFGLGPGETAVFWINISAGQTVGITTITNLTYRHITGPF